MCHFALLLLRDSLYPFPLCTLGHEHGQKGKFAFEFHLPTCQLCPRSWNHSSESYKSLYQRPVGLSVLSVRKELTLFVSSNVLMQRVIVSVSRFLLTGSRLQTDFSRRKHREFNKSAQLKYAAFFFLFISELDDSLFIVRKSSGVLKSAVSVTPTYLNFVNHLKHLIYFS